MTSVSDVILTHVSVQPVAEIQVAVVERQKYVSEETYTHTLITGHVIRRMRSGRGRIFNGNQ